MEFEERNKKPQEAAKNLPMAVLITLVGIVCLLLYVGWQMISDDASNVSELKAAGATVEPKKESTEEAPKEEEVSSEETETQEVMPPPETVSEPEKKEVAEIADAKTTTHTVSAGETMFSIASRYNLTTETLQGYNKNASSKSLETGTKLTIPVMAIHVVGAGDILRVVGGKYGVTVDALIKANGKTKNHAERGERLIIPFKEKK